MRSLRRASTVIYPTCQTITIYLRPPLLFAQAARKHELVGERSNALGKFAVAFDLYWYRYWWYCCYYCCCCYYCRRYRSWLSLSFGGRFPPSLWRNSNLPFNIERSTSKEDFKLKDVASLALLKQTPENVVYLYFDKLNPHNCTSTSSSVFHYSMPLLFLFFSPLVVYRKPNETFFFFLLPHVYF